MATQAALWRAEPESPAMNQPLSYESLEPLKVVRPVDRIGYIAELCRAKRVLDIGCLDETSLHKQDTLHWLHGRITQTARSVIGVDLSDLLPAEGIETAPNARIHRGDGTNPQVPGLVDADIDIVVAGEFIEHIESPLDFFATMRRRFAGRELVISTPNAMGFGNTVLGALRREAQHPDHIHLFSYKILNTLCTRAGFKSWQIVPYRFYATDMILSSRGRKRLAAQATEKMVRAVERMFPLLSLGYVVRAEL